MKNNLLCSGGGVFLGLVLAADLAMGQPVDLLKRYPTTLTGGDAAPDHARAWEFTPQDLYQLTRFHFEVGGQLRVETGPAEVGIGHCSDGAVWAVIVPRDEGKITRQAEPAEAVTHIWLRFHPKELSRLFPPDTVSAAGTASSALAAQVRAVANYKMRSSWQAGGQAMIPEPKDMTVDGDTKAGSRRFFVVDTEAATAEYVGAFEKRALKLPPPLAPGEAEEAFDRLWKAFDRDYAMFVLRPEVDWARLRDQYRPQALQARSTLEFASVCAEMLKPLRDLHVWLTVAGQDVPVFNRPRSANSNPSAHEAILGELRGKGRVQWAVTPDKIGFIAIYGWSGADVPAQCQEALELMRGTRGLILDVRLNGGGGEPLAEEVAARFLEKEFVYAYSRYRNGAAHTNLTDKIPRTVSPGGPWRYPRPVVLLIGQKCMSSNESFIAMMSGAANVTILGDHTCGSSGNPKIVRLPLDMTVSVPKWIDYLPDGTPLDERGFQPQVPFQPQPGAFDGKRDDLLTAALERLRSAPLPDQPIPGPAFTRTARGEPDLKAFAEAEAKDPARPKVISVTPTNGAQGVATSTELRVRFDRPMDPLALKLSWESGGFLHCEFPQYDADRHEFSIPVRLAPGARHQVLVNKVPFAGRSANPRAHSSHDGFQSAERRLAALFQWQFQTQELPPATATEAPKTTSILPQPGSQVALLTFVEIQFDQPMAPPAEAPPYLLSNGSAGERPGLICRVQCDPARRTFRLPLLLPPKTKVKCTLAGFRSAAGVPAPPISLEYQSVAESLAAADRERLDAGAKDPRLHELLNSIEKKHAQLTSVSERVQDLMLTRSQGLFTELRSTGAAFRWQQPDCFYGDVSDVMSMGAFRIGCDGSNWWWHTESDRGTNLVVCPLRAMDDRNTAIDNPFGLDRASPPAAAADRQLNYSGLTSLAKTECHLVEAWNVEPLGEHMTFGDLTQWWLDPASGRVNEIASFSDGWVTRKRFLYDAVNQPLPPTAFAVPKLEGVTPKPAEALDDDYTARFVNLRDGSDGQMSVRWGKQGPKGRSSSGLN